MNNRFKEIQAGVINTLLTNISYNFLRHEKNDSTVVKDYSEHFDLYSSLVKDYALNRQAYDKLYPAIKTHNHGEFMSIEKRFERTHLDYACDGMKVILILMEELKSRNHGNT